MPRVSNSRSIAYLLVLLAGSSLSLWSSPQPSSTPRQWMRQGKQAFQAKNYVQAYRSFKRLDEWLLERQVHRKPEKLASVTRVHYLVGATLFQARRYQGAARYWRQTLSLDPDHAKATRGLERLARAGKISPEEVSPALDFPPPEPEVTPLPEPPTPSPPPATPLPSPGRDPDLLAGVQVNPDKPAADRAWSSFREARDRGKVPAALESLRQAFAAGASRGQVDYELGLLYLREENPDQALVHLTRSLQSGDEDARQLHLSMGKAHALKGNLETEIAEYQHALELDPDLGESHFLLAIAYDKAKNSPRVIEHAQKAIRINPNYKDALKRRIPDSDLAQKLEEIFTEVIGKSRREQLSDELIEEYAERLSQILGAENLQASGVEGDRARFTTALTQIREGKEPLQAARDQFEGRDKTRFIEAFKNKPELRQTFQEFRKKYQAE